MGRNVNGATEAGIAAADQNGRSIGSIPDLKRAAARKRIGKGRTLIAVVENQRRTVRKADAARAEALRIVNGRRVAVKHGN